MDWFMDGNTLCTVVDGDIYRLFTIPDGGEIIEVDTVGFGHTVQACWKNKDTGIRYGACFYAPWLYRFNGSQEKQQPFVVTGLF